MPDSTVTIVGNLTRDPELRFTPGGLAVANFGVAVNNRRKKPGTEEWEDVPSFFDVAAFGSLAENVSESIGKGQRVVVSGRLEQRSWETDSGDKRSKVELVADAMGPDLRWATAEITKTGKTAQAQTSRRPVTPYQNQTHNDDPVESF